jgi:hypothetical protein
MSDRWQKRAQAARRREKKELRAVRRERHSVLRVRRILSLAIERQQAIRERVNTTYAERRAWGDRAVDALSRALRNLDEAIRYAAR